MDKNKLTFDAPCVFEDGCRIWTRIDNKPIGYATLSRNDNIAKLCDIYIYDKSWHLFTLLPKLKIGKNYRNKGYGTELLLYVFQFCTAQHIDVITGTVNGEISRLIPWYKSLGFNVRGKNKLYKKLRS